MQYNLSATTPCLPTTCHVARASTADPPLMRDRSICSAPWRGVPESHTRQLIVRTRRILAHAASLIFSTLLAFGVIASTPASAATFANFEVAQTNPVRLSADGTRLFAVNTPAGTLSVFDVTQKNDIAAYLLCFDTGTAPAVGFSGTLTAATVSHWLARRNWATLQDQAAKGNIDLIMRGTLNGQVHGLLYEPASNTYSNDLGAPFSQAQLQSLIEAGDTLTVLGVYPGTGTASRR